MTPEIARAGPALQGVLEVVDGIERPAHGDPNALGFLAAVNAVPLTPLGVTRFGQSGDLEDVYRHHEIDAESIVGAALDLLG